MKSTNSLFQGERSNQKVNHMNERLIRTTGSGWSSESGRSMIETLAVIAIASLLTAMAVPQLISARRLIRTNALPREIAAQMRFARQQAMSQRQAFTFQYDNSTKTIKVFDHNNNNNATAGCNITGVAVLSASNYPNTSCSTTVLTVPLTTSAVPAADLLYGVPTGITNTTLDDGGTPTALVGTVLNITFQTDGTVVDTGGNYVTRTFYFYNNQIPTQSATAISVLGSAGRVKIWRYTSGANKYVE
jgi:Tfp pilus assembly protein FimT